MDRLLFLNFWILEGQHQNKNAIDPRLFTHFASHALICPLLPQKISVLNR